MDVLLMILLVQALSLVAFARFHRTTVLRLAVLRRKQNATAGGVCFLGARYRFLRVVLSLVYTLRASRHLEFVEVWSFETHLDRIIADHDQKRSSFPATRPLA